MTDAEKPKLEIDWLKTFAGALAALSSAVLLSTLGAAGTLIGAALGSVVVTVTSALYAQGLARSRARLSQTQELALARAGVTRSEVRRAQAELDPAVEEAVSSADEPTARARLAGLPWRRIAVGAAAMFLVAVAALTAFEVIAGRSVSSYTGGTTSQHGTSLTGLTGSGTERGGSQDRPDDESSPTPSGADSPADDATDDAADDAADDATEQPTDDATDEPTDDPSEPTAPTEPSESTDPAVPTPSAPAPTTPATSPLG